MVKTLEERKKPFIDAHLDYPDVMPNGIEEYPFVRSRIMPVFYEIPDGAKVLDIGCNSGEFMRMLKEKKRCDVYGVDISAKVVDLAKAKGLNVQVVDADALPMFPDKTFDVVTMMEVLEHFHDPLPYLKEVRRVLKDDGIFLGSCPHANLERHIWEDERLHQQYYREENLEKDLGVSFETTHLRVLTGAQFAMSFANSFLAKEPCEILFKCGGKNMEQWESALKNEKVTRAWFGFTMLSGTVYYRMRGYADKMHKFGVEAAYDNFEYDGSESQTMWQNRIWYPSPDGKVNWNKVILNQFDQLLKIADISIWQLVGNNQALALLQTAKKGLNKKVITEIDDWLFDMPAYNVASNPYKPNSLAEKICMDQIDLSDALIVSTQYMIEHLKKIFPGKPMYLVPNSIDMPMWNKAVPKKTKEYEKAPGVIRIGYTGCGNHSGDLELMKRPLLKLLEEFPNLEFMTSVKFDCFEEVNNPRMKFLNHWVGMDHYPAEAKGWNMDIGIAPLRDNNFNRSKSNLRWLEYSTLRIPTVASKVYPFKKSITHGIDGIICNSELEWYEALKSLIVNEGKRVTMGNRAHKRVKRDFDMINVTRKYAGILKDIHHDKGRN